MNEIEVVIVIGSKQRGRRRRKTIKKS